MTTPTPGRSRSTTAVPLALQDDPQATDWRAAVDAWLDSKRRLSGGENTVKAYSIALRQFLEFAGAAPWAVGSADAQAWAAHLGENRNGSTLSPATVAVKLAALSSFYDYVLRRHRAPERDGRPAAGLWPVGRGNPFDVVQRPRVSAYGRAHYPSTDEVRRLLAAIDPHTLVGKRDFALLYAFVTTCRRSSELLHLRWGDVERTEDHVSFAYRYKGGNVRRQALPQAAYQAIAAYLAASGRPPEGMGPGEYVFAPLYPGRELRFLGRPLAAGSPLARGATPLSNHQANAILRKWGRAAGLRREVCHVHGLRHAGARLRYQRGRARGAPLDMGDLMELLGHSSLAITQIYWQQVVEDPRDPGGEDAAEFLMSGEAGRAEAPGKGRRMR